MGNVINPILQMKKLGYDASVTHWDYILRGEAKSHPGSLTQASHLQQIPLASQFIAGAEAPKQKWGIPSVRSPFEKYSGHLTTSKAVLNLGRTLRVTWGTLNSTDAWVPLSEILIVWHVVWKPRFLKCSLGIQRCSPGSELTTSIFLGMV